MIKDPSARIPLTALGGLLILISSIFYVQILSWNLKLAEIRLQDIEFSQMQHALKYQITQMENQLVESGIWALDYAGRNYLAKLGTDIIHDSNSVCAGNMSDRELEEYLGQGCNSTAPSEKLGDCRLNWIKSMMAWRFNSYPNSNWIQGMEFRIGKLDPKNLSLDPIYAELEAKSKPVYYSVNANLELEYAWDNDSRKIPVNITQLIPSKYPLLENLTQELERELKNWWFTALLFTGISAAEIWGKGWAQFSMNQFSTNSSFEVYDSTDLRLDSNLIWILTQTKVVKTIDPYSICGLSRDVMKQFSTLGFVSSDLGERLEDVCKQLVGLPSLLNQILVLSDRGLDGLAHLLKEIESNARSSHYELISGIVDKLSQELIQMGEYHWEANGSEILNEVIHGIYSVNFSTHVLRKTLDSWRDGECPPDTEYTEQGGISCQYFQQQTEDFRSQGTQFPGIIESRRYLAIQSQPVGCYRTICEQVNNTTQCGKQFIGSYTQHYNQSVQIQVEVESYSDYSPQLEFDIPSPKNSIQDALYSKQFREIQDPNLNDSYLIYLQEYDPFSSQNICYGDGIVSSARMHGSSPDRDWLRSQIRDQLTMDIQNISSKLKHFSSESLDPIQILKQLRDRMEVLFQEELRESLRDFHDGSKYSSAAAATIYLGSAQLLNSVWKNISIEGIDKSSQEINSRLKWISDGDHQSRLDILRNGFGMLELIGNLLELRSELELDFGDWKEKAVIKVDQYPDYLDFEGSGGLSGRSISIPGSNGWKGGIPLLPPPLPWWIDFNFWYLSSNLQIERYALMDLSQYPIRSWGMNLPQVLIRESKSICDPVTGKFIGENIPIQHDLWTLIPIIVPPSVKGVGDGSIDSNFKSGPIELLGGDRADLKQVLGGEESEKYRAVCITEEERDVCERK